MDKRKRKIETFLINTHQATVEINGKWKMISGQRRKWAKQKLLTQLQTYFCSVHEQVKANRRKKAKHAVK